MKEHSNEPCWKIMKCDASKDCVGKNVWRHPAGRLLLTLTLGML